MPKYYQAIIYQLSDEYNNPVMDSDVFNPTTDKNTQIKHVYDWFNDAGLSLNNHLTLTPKLLRDFGLPYDVVFVDDESYCQLNKIYQFNEEVLRRVVDITCKGEFQNNLWWFDIYEWDI